MLTPSPRPPHVTAILADYEVLLIEVPDVNRLLDSFHRPFSYDENLFNALTARFFTV